MALILFLLLVFTGCGNKPAGDPPKANVARPEPPDTRPVILAFGDSLTAGYGVEPGQAWPDLLQKALDAKGGEFRVVNAGISGDTTSGGLARIDTALSLKPRLVVLELGGNDGLRGLPVDATRANLEEMILAFRKTGAKLLLAGMTLPPNYGAVYISQFEKMYADLAARHKLKLIPFRSANIAGHLQPDGLHPTAEGYRRLLPYLMKFIEPEL